jgi:hypothetical protein
MPRTCTVCTHAEHRAIDEALVSGAALPAIAAQYRVSQDALGRHKARHLPAAMVQAQGAAEVAHGDNLLAQVRDLQTKALGILSKAEGFGDMRTALLAIAQARACLELLAKLLGELQQEGSVSIVLAPEWVSLRAIILAALVPYPDARQAVVEALRGHAGG